MTVPTDQELWRRACHGDAEAFGVLYERHDRAVRAYCLWRTGDPALADDLTSTVFLEAWRLRRRTAITTETARPYLLGVATNLVRGQWRARRRHAAALARIAGAAVPSAGEDDENVARLAARERLDALRTQLEALPRRELEVLALVALVDLSYDEAAAALGVPVGTVRSRLSRARARLADAPDGDVLVPARPRPTTETAA